MQRGARRRLAAKRANWRSARPEAASRRPHLLSRPAIWRQARRLGARPNGATDNDEAEIDPLRRAASANMILLARPLGQVGRSSSNCFTGRGERLSAPPVGGLAKISRPALPAPVINIRLVGLGSLAGRKRPQASPSQARLSSARFGRCHRHGRRSINQSGAECRTVLPRGPSPRLGPPTPPERPASLPAAGVRQISSKYKNNIARANTSQVIRAEAAQLGAEQTLSAPATCRPSSPRGPPLGPPARHLATGPRGQTVIRLIELCQRPPLPAAKSDSRAPLSLPRRARN